jgi:hypothetical protein
MRGGDLYFNLTKSTAQQSSCTERVGDAIYWEDPTPLLCTGVAPHYLPEVKACPGGSEMEQSPSVLLLFSYPIGSTISMLAACHST